MPGVLDSHNWGGDDDSGWINSDQGIALPLDGRKIFGQFETPGQFGKVGHYREAPITFHEGQVYSQMMKVTHGTYTDVCFGLRSDPGFDVYGCVGVYFGAYQTGKLEAFLWDVNTPNTSSIRVPIVPGNFYSVKIVTKFDGKIEAFIGNESLGVSANWGSAPYQNIYGMFAFGQSGNGSGIAVIDKYLVRW